jgi:hypothetical protein
MDHPAESDLGVILSNAPDKQVTNGVVGSQSKVQESAPKTRRRWDIYDGTEPQ